MDIVLGFFRIFFPLPRDLSSAFYKTRPERNGNAERGGDNGGHLVNQNTKL